MVTKKQILARIDELTNLIKSDEFNHLKQESEELKRIKALLPNIKFKVKDINYYKENNVVQIRYELPVITLQLNEEGEPSRDEFFYATNVLEMISLEDMQKIMEYLEKCKLMERN